jgi:hypothetical protein
MKDFDKREGFIGHAVAAAISKCRDTPRFSACSGVKRTRVLVEAIGEHSEHVRFEVLRCS